MIDSAKIQKMLLKNELCVLKNSFYLSFSTFQKTAKPADFLYKPEYQPVTVSTTFYLFNAIL